MSPQRWHQVSTLFSALVELPPSERAGELARLCAGEDELHDQVQRLLAADERAGATSELPSALADSRCDHHSRLGQYSLHEVLHEGGSSTVYLGRRDGDFEQRVAIKVLDRGAADPELRRRFRIERQVLASLEHPNVARLCDGGATADGRLFLVMEYIEGEPIDLYCRRRGLGVAARVELFLQVVSAVEHAHQHWLVHRDLKPSNVLVTSRGQVKLLDFGIAKMLVPDDKIEMLTTQTGVRPMTPAFASPEQVLGRPVTTSSDVFSLGVLLFLLLTGRRPYRLANGRIHELEQAICEEQAPRPSVVAGRVGMSHSRRLRGDLDTVILKALEKRPARRYPSAAGFADDLRRCLDNRPIRARRASVLYRATKFVRRHHLPVALAAMTLVIALASWFLIHRQSVQIEKSRSRAEQVAALFLERVSQTPVVGDGAVLRTALDAAAHARLRRLVLDPVQLGRQLRDLGAIYAATGLSEDARWLLDASIEVLGEELGAEHPDFATARQARGQFLLTLGEVEASQRDLASALGQRRRAGDQRGIAETLEVLAALLRGRGEIGEADRALSESVELRRKLCPRALWLAEGESDLGSLRLQQGRIGEASARFAAAAAIRSALRQDHPEHARTLEDSAELAVARRQWELAENLYRAALEVRLDTVGETHPAAIRTAKGLARVVAGG